MSALGEASLRETFLQAIQGAGYRRVADVYLDAAENNAPYLLAELLVDFDEVWMRWRSEHQALAERMIGRSRGTGGTQGPGKVDQGRAEGSLSAWD